MFYIIYYDNKSLESPADVYLFKLDVTSIKWEELQGLKDWDLNDLNYAWWENNDHLDFKHSLHIWEEIDGLKDANLFLDRSRDQSVSYSRVIASELRGYIHIRGKMGKTIYSYHVKDKTISLFSIPSPILPTSHVSIWECRYCHKLIHVELSSVLLWVFNIFFCPKTNIAIVTFRSLKDDFVSHMSNYKTRLI